MERGWKNGTNTTTTLYKTAMCTGLYGQDGQNLLCFCQKNLF